MRKVFYLLWNIILTIRFFAMGILTKLLHRDPIKRRIRCSHDTNYISKRYLKALRIKTRLFNAERLELLKQKNYLIVANHVSYTDILVLSSLGKFVFITSEEMGKTPFLGTITRYGGSLFTDRKKYVSLPKEIERFSETARQGFNIVLFAEGTSTDGSQIRAFRSSLFEIALKSGLDVLPICINYVKIDNQPRSEANRDTICWYGDMSFAPHFWGLMGHSIEAEIHILEPVSCTTHSKRQELSNAVYDAINTCYHK